MNDGKKIYMDLSNPQPKQKENDSLSHKVKEEIQDFGLESMIDEMNIEIVDGIAQISMPEPLLTVLMTLFKKLEQATEQGITR